MQIHLDRNRLFALLGAFEEDLRSLIEEHLLTTHHEEQIFGAAHARALERFHRDEQRDIAQTSVIDYLDLGDELEILNRWQDDLPAQIGESFAKISGRLAELVPIRNRVVHRRPLLADDFDNVKDSLSQLDSNGFSGPSLRNCLEQLRTDTDWSPVEPGVLEGASTLNNLPLADYDETGLVGRRRELERLTTRLLRLGTERSPVLTVIGPGGVGKTALVLQALHDLVNDQSCPYDLVSWVSLKTEQLTARGVQSIQDAVLSVEQAVPAMIEALEPGFAGNASQLADSLDGLTTLIVIDNLETVTGQEVVDLIDALPNSVSYLLTSREGLGELERRFPLDPLGERYALDLLRRLARARNLTSFASIEQDVGLDIVRRLAASPLGLKWFVSSVEMGKDPEELIRHRDDLVRFCVENVFETLDDESESVAQVLHLLNRPTTIQELHLFLPEIATDRLRVSIQALDRRMLIRNDRLPGSITQTFEATATLTEFLRITNVVSPDEAQRIRETDDEHRRAEERHRIDAASDPLRPNIVQGGQVHRASVLRLRDALLKSKQGNVQEALQDIRDAEMLDPEFWELHRVRGFILSGAGRVDDATAAYTRAVELAPTPEDCAVVKYYFAGHLARIARDSFGAEPLAREAHDVLEHHKTALELGRVLTYLGEYVEAESHLSFATSTEDARTRLIALTQLMDCMKRRAETEGSAERQPDKAVSTLSKAIEIGMIPALEGFVDRKLRAKIVDLASELLRLAIMCDDLDTIAGPVSEALGSTQALGAEARRAQSHGYLIGHARRLALQYPSLVAKVPLLGQYASTDSEPLLQSLERDASNDPGQMGSIKVWKPDRNFGFITALDGRDDYYFNRASLSMEAHEIYLARGATVRFVPGVAMDGRSRAQDVIIDDTRDDQLVARRVQVTSRMPENGYLFSIDEVSGATVFVGRHAVAESGLWNRIKEGMVLEVGVEIDEKGRFRAAERSVRPLH